MALCFLSHLQTEIQTTQQEFSKKFAHPTTTLIKNISRNTKEATPHGAPISCKIVCLSQWSEKVHFLKSHFFGAVFHARNFALNVGEKHFSGEVNEVLFKKKFYHGFSC
jgi:hypothetical protein